MTNSEDKSLKITQKNERWRILRDKIFTVLGILFIPILVFGAIGIFFLIYNEYHKEINGLIEGKNADDLIVYIVSWLILLFISYMATHAIKEILKEQAKDVLRKRANYIAIMIGLVLVIFLFKQPYLDELFKNQNTGFWLRSVLFTGGGTAGWVVWYLRQINKYGEFFNVFLFTTVTGFCWYARLTAPEQIQLTAVAFLLASLFRVAKDYLDEAAKEEKQKVS